MLELTRDKDAATRFRACAYLLDRRYGRAKQAVEFAAPTNDLLPAGRLVVEDTEIHALADRLRDRLVAVDENSRVVPELKPVNGRAVEPEG